MVAIAAVGICIPPLGMGLATLIGRKNFSAEERETCLLYTSVDIDALTPWQHQTIYIDGNAGAIVVEPGESVEMCIRDRQ